MTQFNGNRALLQAFLADAERYLDEFIGALAPSAELPAEMSMDTALEALRGIRIGAEFLQIGQLADFCRQQESYLVSASGGVPQEDAQEVLMRAGRELGAQLQALGGTGSQPAAGRGDPRPFPVRPDAAWREDRAQLSPAPIPATSRETDAASPSMGGEGAGPGLAEEETSADAYLFGKVEIRDVGRAPARAASAESDISPAALAGEAPVPGDEDRQSAPVTAMFQEWMREWRAFREQIERLYLGPPPGVSAAAPAVDNVMPPEGAEAAQAEIGAGLGPAEEFSDVEDEVTPASLASPSRRAPRPADSEPVAVLKLGVGNTLYALPASRVLGFVEPQRDVTQLAAHTDLAAVNDATVPVMDLRRHWDLGARPADARIVLVESDHGRVGLWADRVHGTESVRIQPLVPRACYPAALDGAALSAQGEVVLLLRPESIAGPVEGA